MQNESRRPNERKAQLQDPTYCHLDFDVTFGTQPNQLLDVRSKYNNFEFIDPQKMMSFKMWS